MVDKSNCTGVSYFAHHIYVSYTIQMCLSEILLLCVYIYTFSLHILFKWSLIYSSLKYIFVYQMTKNNRQIHRNK